MPRYADIMVGGVVSAFAVLYQCGRSLSLIFESMADHVRRLGAVRVVALLVALPPCRPEKRRPSLTPA